jgi:glycosyltransferase involved in cell wall biosynthesis
MVAPTSFFADYGCHVRILEEARVLRRLGQRVTIVTYRNGDDVSDLAIRRTLPIPWRRDYEVGSSRHKLAFDALLGLSTLRAALRLRPDIVHGHLHEGALIGGIVAALMRRPLVFDYQGSLSDEMVDHHFLRRGSRWFGATRRLERLIDHLPDAIVTSSRPAADHLASDFGVDRRRITSLPDCVDGTIFRPGVLGPKAVAAGRRSLGIPEGRSVVVYLGLLARHQGTDLLLRAARGVIAKRPNTHFLVMGFPGTEVYADRARALGLGGHVTFTGRVPYGEAPVHLALGDVAVAPKLSATEGSGKLLNYMAMALPSVAFDTPVNRDYLGVDGVLVEPGDEAAFGAALLAQLADLPAARAAGKRLRARALERFDWSHAGRSLLEVYDRVIAARQVRPVSREAGMPPPALRDAAAELLRRDGIR